MTAEEETKMANKYSKEELLKAFKCTKNNREPIMSGETASCPYCYEESVIGEKSGHSITTEFLVAMNEYWYKGIRGLCLDWRNY